MSTWIAEYRSAADYYAQHNRLPDLVSSSVMRRINYDPEAFYEDVRSCRYARAMYRLAPVDCETCGAECRQAGPYAPSLCDDCIREDMCAREKAREECDHKRVNRWVIGDDNSTEEQAQCSDCGKVL